MGIYEVEQLNRGQTFLTTLDPNFARIFIIYEKLTVLLNRYGNHIKVAYSTLF